MNDKKEISWLVTKELRSKRLLVPYGWRLHAVEKALGDRTVTSACGRRRQWGFDLFVEKKCAQCLRALGLACKACKGTGHAPRDSNSCQCLTCDGTGEAQVGP